MRTFFRRTYYLWIVTRILVALAFVISIAGILLKGSLKDVDEVLINLFSLVYLITQIVLTVQELSQRTVSRWAEIFTGVFSIMLAIGLTYIFFMGYPSSHNWVMLILPVWLAIFGIRYHTGNNSLLFRGEDTEDGTA
jgi:uncharacterized membrane protein YhaH (DUF805 family)